MPNPIEGRPLVIDVSQYQGGQSRSKGWQTYLDFAALKAAGVSGCIIRIDYGPYTDPLFTIHRDAAKAAGLLIGYYAFPVRTINLPYQVNKYAALANLQPNDGIITCTDWETSGGDTMSLSLMEQWQTMLCAKICRPVVTYSSRGMVGDIAPGATRSILGQMPLCSGLRCVQRSALAAILDTWRLSVVAVSRRRVDRLAATASAANVVE